MKTRIEEAAVIHSTQMRGEDFSDVSNNVNFELMNQSFRAGAEFMQGEVEKKNIEIMEYSKDLNNYIRDHGNLLLQKAQLEAKLEKAESVIRFYADKENWNETKDGRYKTEGIFFISRDVPFLQVENGMKAREYFEGKEARE